MMASLSPVVAVACWLLGAGGAVEEANALAASAFSLETCAGHVGSRGEWRRWTGVVENNVSRSVSGLVALTALAHAVQLDVILPLCAHLSAVCGPAQYGHIIGSLQWLDVWPSTRQFMHRGMVFLPKSVRLLYRPKKIFWSTAFLACSATVKPMRMEE